MNRSRCCCVVDWGEPKDLPRRGAIFRGKDMPVPGMPDNTAVSCAQTAERIKMPFELWAWVGSKNHVLDGVSIPPIRRSNFRGKDMLGMPNDTLL